MKDIMILVGRGSIIALAIIILAVAVIFIAAQTADYSHLFNWR